MSNTYREAWSVFHSKSSLMPTPAYPSPSQAFPLQYQQHMFAEPSPYSQSLSSVGSRCSPSVSEGGGRRQTTPSTTTHSPSGSLGSINQNMSPEMSMELERLREDYNSLQTSRSSSGEPNQVDHIGKKLDLLSNLMSSASSPSQYPGVAAFDLDQLSVISSSSAGSQTQSQSPGSLRCWKPCCNGRQFSNKSNLIRHQRERRSDSSSKLRCSFCDAQFSRSSARNAHEAARRCKK